MADPRLTVGFDNLHAQFLSAIIDDDTITYSALVENGSAAVGKAVKFSADGAVIALTVDASGVLGRLGKVEADGVALVQYHGFMVLPAGYGVSELTLMKKIVGDLGPATAPGYIREVNTAAPAELGVARGFAQDDSVLTAVSVYL